jgi:hypothetical protein
VCLLDFVLNLIICLYTLINTNFNNGMFCAGPVQGEPGSGKNSSRVHPLRYYLADVHYYVLFPFLCSAIKAYCKCRLLCVVLFTFFKFSGTLPCGSHFLQPWARSVGKVKQKMSYSFFKSYKLFYVMPLVYSLMSSSVAGHEQCKKKHIYVVIRLRLNVVFGWREKKFVRKNRNVVIPCSVNMFPRYPVLEK